MCKRYMDQLPLAHFPTDVLAPNPGMCPDWELNQQHFGQQASAQSTDPHQPGHKINLLFISSFSTEFPCFHFPLPSGIHCSEFDIYHALTLNSTG